MNRPRKLVTIGGRRWERVRGVLYEVRRRVVARVSCPSCRALRPLYATTIAWTRGPRSKRALHQDYGPGAGHCAPCELHFATDLDGEAFAYRSPRKP